MERSFLRKLLCILLLSFLTFFTSSCKKVEQNLVVGQMYLDTYAVRTIGPLQGTVNWPDPVSTLIYDGLVDLNPVKNYEVYPGLAESWDITEDGLLYTFKLRKNVKWHDGEAFDAEDVAFSYSLVQDANLMPMGYQDYIFIDKITIIDPYTISFHFSRKFAPAIKYFALPIVPAHLLKNEIAKGVVPNTSEFAKKPVGTGPFEYSEYKPGESLTFTANKKYYKGAPKLEKIIFVNLENPGAAVLRLKAGEIDITDLPGTQVKEFTNDNRYVIDYKKGVNIHGIALNVNKPLFADPRVRIALNQMVDRKALIDGLEGGRGTPATSPINNHAWATDDCNNLSFNVEQAVQNLKAAGFKLNSKGIWEKNGQKLSFTYTDHFLAEISQLVVDMWRKNGVDVKLEFADGNTFIPKLMANPNNYDAVSTDWNSAVEADSVYIIFHSSASLQNGGYNMFGWSNREADAALDASRTAKTENERKAFYVKFQKAEAQDPPYVTLHSADINLVINRQLQGWDPGIPEYGGTMWACTFHNVEKWHK